MKKILLIVCLISLLSGCSTEINKSSISEITNAIIEITEAIKATSETIKKVTTEPKTEPTEKEILLSKNSVNINEATDLLLRKLQNYGRNVEPNQHLKYEKTEVYNNTPCYVFRSYDDFDDHRTTTGWYAVNPVTGECFDTTTEHTPLFYTFDITKSGVEVYEKYADKPLQLLEIDPGFTPDPEWLYEKYQDDYFNHDPYRFITMNDFDFDGYDDIEVWVYLGATNAVFQYYHFNPDTGLFEEWYELNELHFGVHLCIQDKTFSVSSKSSAVDHYNDVYKWSEGKLMHVSGVKQYYSSEAKEIYIDYLEYDNYENETLVKRERVILDENHEYQGKEEVDINCSTN